MKLFEPFTLGGLLLPNRIVMAPMTRNRATGTVPQEMAVIHYAARASAGLIVSEATQVSARGQGYANTPGIHTREYLHVMEEPIGDLSPTRLMRGNFHGALLSSGSYIRDSGEEALQTGLADLVAFGRAFTANPDLVEKFRANARLSLPDPKTFYSGGARGYIDALAAAANPRP
jgi:2,4-dienoyl-CoA reductase-like NADH-dependent reductase (Old Yellow Enzyme family)